MSFPKDELAFGLGLLGTVLGVINLWRTFDRDRVKLRVTPKVAYPVNMGDDRPRLCVEVVNLSTFPVTVSDVGFTVWFSRSRMAIIDPILLDRKPWPRRLEPREAFTVYCSPSLAGEPGLQRVRRAYAKTDCGETRYGRSKGLRHYIGEAAKETS
ncbi:MAG: hypothetical protein ACREYC_08205 [Gammaproteobacteria bacterium]